MTTTKYTAEQIKAKMSLLRLLRRLNVIKENYDLFGDGSDGDVTIGSGAQMPTLHRDMYFRNLTVGRNVRFETRGFKVFVSGTLTLL